jgi:hypothetical protein
MMKEDYSALLSIQILKKMASFIYFIQPLHLREGQIMMREIQGFR